MGRVGAFRQIRLGGVTTVSPSLGDQLRPRPHSGGSCGRAQLHGGYGGSGERVTGAYPAPAGATAGQCGPAEAIKVHMMETFIHSRAPGPLPVGRGRLHNSAQPQVWEHPDQLMAETESRERGMPVAGRDPVLVAIGLGRPVGRAFLCFLGGVLPRCRHELPSVPGTCLEPELAKRDRTRAVSCSPAADLPVLGVARTARAKSNPCRRGASGQRQEPTIGAGSPTTQGKGRAGRTRIDINNLQRLTLQVDGTHGSERRLAAGCRPGGPTDLLRTLSAL